MPSGKTHERFELFSLPIILAGVLWIDKQYQSFSIGNHLYGLFVASYLFSVFYLSPDLDLKHCRARKNWGLLGIIWRPYSYIFSHRGISHSPFFGTWTRVLYLILLFILGGLILGMWQIEDWKNWHNVLLAIKMYSKEIGGLFLGLSTPNFLHIFLDRIN